MEQSPPAEQKPIRKFAEAAYVLGILLLSSGVVLMTKADFGISMVVAPAYLLSLKVSFLSFGLAEYVMQAALLILFCLVLRQFRWQYLLSFATALIYGAVLDLEFLLMQGFVPVGIFARILTYIAGVLVSALALAFFFHTYFQLEVYDMVVKLASERLEKPISRCKMVYDVTSCIVAVVLSLLFFGDIRGVGVGTVVCALVNGYLIGLFCRILEKYIDFSPALPKLFALLAPKNQP